MDGFVWRHRVCPAHPVPTDGRYSGGTPRHCCSNQASSHTLLGPRRPGPLAPAGPITQEPRSAPSYDQGSCPAVLASGHRAHALGSRTWNRYSSPPASCEGNARPDAPTAGVVLGTVSCAGAAAAHRCDRAVGVSPPGPSSAWARSTRRAACPRRSLAGAPAALLRGPRVAQDVGDVGPRALQACVRAGAAGCAGGSVTARIAGGRSA